MKYYQNKTTSEIVGIENMREVISFPTEQGREMGYRNYSYSVVYDMVCPNKILGNGITSFCITHGYLTANYKRISKKIALLKYPSFRQYRYEHLKEDAKKQGCATLEVIQKQRF